MPSPLVSELYQAIQILDAQRVRALLAQHSGSSDATGVQGLYAALERRVIDMPSPSRPCAAELVLAETIYLALFDAFGPGAASPFLSAWWSDRLVNVMLDRGFDPHEEFVGEHGRFGVLSLCLRACSGETVERLLRLCVEAGEDGPLAYHPIVLAASHLNHEAVRYLLGFMVTVPETVSLEELTRDAIRIVAADPGRNDDFRILVKHLVGGGVPANPESGKPSALAMAFKANAYGAVEVLLDAGSDPRRDEPGIGIPVEQAIERSGDLRMKELYRAWMARVEAARHVVPAKTFDNTLHDPLTVHPRGRTLN